MPILRASALRFSYPGKLQLSVDDFSVQENQIAIIIGENSSGKSTLCRLLAKVIAPDSGEVITFGEPPVLVWQEGELFPGTVARNIHLIARQGRSASERDALVEQLSDSLDLRKYMDWDVTELSGGAKQRLAIARALAAKNRHVRIFDEPTRSLDPNNIETVANQIRSTHASTPGGGTIVITHDPRMLMLLDDEDVVLYILEKHETTHARGHKLVISRLSGPVPSHEFIESPPTEYAAKLLNYENVFGLNNPQAGITLNNLIPLQTERPSEAFCVIPPNAIRLVASGAGHNEVQITRAEFRTGSIRLIRCKLNQSVELLTFDRRSIRCNSEQQCQDRRRNANPAARVGVVLDPTKCFRRDVARPC